MLYYLSFRIKLNDDLSASYSSKSHVKCIEAPKLKHIHQIIVWIVGKVCFVVKNALIWGYVCCVGKKKCFDF